MAETPQQAVDPEDRIYWMRDWLAKNQNRINDINKGSVTFDFSGSKLVVKVQGFEEIFKEKIKGP